MPSIVMTLERHSVRKGALPGFAPARVVTEPCPNSRHPRGERTYARLITGLGSRAGRHDADGGGLRVDRLTGEVPM